MASNAVWTSALASIDVSVNCSASAGSAPFATAPMNPFTAPRRATPTTGVPRKSPSAELASTEAVGSPVVTAAAGAATLAAPENSRRLAASVAHASGAAIGASGSPVPPSHDSGLRSAESAPRGVAAVSAAVGAGAGAAGAMSCSNAAGTTGAFSTTGSTTGLSATAGTDTVDARFSAASVVGETAARRGRPGIEAAAPAPAGRAAS